MSDDQPPPFLPPDDAFGDVDQGASVALVSTLEAYNLYVERIADDRVPEGMVCMGSFLNQRLIARSAVAPEVLEDLLERRAFREPARLALAAVEQEPGLQCRLFALLPAALFLDEDDREPEEPWAASVPRFEDSFSSEDRESEDAVVPLLLGHVVRFARDRKHPADLASEAADVLQTVLLHDVPLSNVVDKLLDDLLDS